MKEKNKNITPDPVDEVVNDIQENAAEDTEPASESVEAVQDDRSAEGTDEQGDNDESDVDEVVDGDGESEQIEDNDGRIPTYRPRFTEVSEQYRRKGDAKIRERLGIKDNSEADQEGNPDEIKLDPTAEFEADISGTQGAMMPENSAVDESDESISVMKFATEEDELEAEAEKERQEIKKLLFKDSVPDKEDKKEEVIDEPEEEPIEEEEEYTLPDPDEDEIKVYEFVDHKVDESETSEVTGAPSKNRKNEKNDREFSNPIQRDGIKDRFLDLLLSIKIRMGASVLFTVAIILLELLSATGTIGFNVFEGSANCWTLGIIDFLLASCVFIMAAPELISAIRDLFNKKLSGALIVIPLFVVYGLYTLSVIYSESSKYTLLGLVFAATVIPVLTASLHRAKADFIAFKMIAQPENKQAIELNNTRELPEENNALDGVVDEYKSRLSRTVVTSFVTDFFKNSESAAISPKHFGIVYGIPFGVSLVAAVVYFFLADSFIGAASMFALMVMLGCPAFAAISSKVSFFHAQRAALNTDSTAIGEDSYHNYSAVDVFAFDDTDLFGPEDVNLKRFMLYGDRDNMDKVMRQMCALFAAVGGPLDYMFSGIIDNRMRHKTASNVIIEDDGICGDVAGRRICAGSEDYMRRNGIAIPSAAMGRDTGTSDTIKIMYAAEDGEVNAKFYIRYSFSEEFTSIIPSLRDSGIIPLIYTRDPNVSNELLSVLNTNGAVMRVVKLYDPTNQIPIEPKKNARMITYGDKLDAAEMMVLSKKYHRFASYMRFAEICAMIIGVMLALTLSIVTRNNLKAVPMAALWHILLCAVVRLSSKTVFLKDSKKKSMD